MVVAGKDNLEIFLSLINHFVENSVYSDIFDGSYISNNSTPYAVKLLLMKPVICYVEKGSLSSNNSYVNFKSYADHVIDIEDVYTLLVLRNLELNLQKKLEINWIVYETPIALAKSTFMATMCTIDILLERGESNTVGRLNYKNIEKLFQLIFSKENMYKLTGKKKCKSFLSCCLKIFPTFRKNKYAISVARNGDNYNLSKEDMDKVYRTKCYVCNKVFSVVLYGNMKTNKDKYIFPDHIMNAYNYDGQAYAEMICHKCREGRKINRAMLHIDSKPKSEAEFNNIFLKLFNSLLIDEDMVLRQSRNIVFRSKIEEHHNNAK